ncbi:methyl-accepting chemotaxis protein [Photobacterium lipolyticum]|uniref:Methyl-accepting chemotaxis protein n=1 Tax=Photobacterium lipolyticum TaxID=266810 RepID=A0A2T3N2A9_9GAMM|nr:methyl-accepting chemotaxis protein [Photobacterium lipolyticum]PSW06520.1 methyl-accepting chemotaxis protein [Photobacterium lipolyticum]
MKTLGFKNTILASIIILVTACLLVANWLSYVHLRDSTIQSVNTQSLSTVRYEANKIETWFQGKINAVDSLANHYQPGLPSERYLETAKLTKSTSGLTAVLYGFDNGRAYSTIAGAVWVDGIANPNLYDPRTRPWYQQAKSANGLDLTDIYPDSTTGNYVISVVKKVADGVILGDIELDVLTKNVKNINFPGAVATIVDGTGKALASNSSKLTIGTRLADIGMADVQRVMQSQDESTLPYTLNGVDKLSFTKELKLINGHKWYLVIGMDKSIAYTAVNDALTSAIISSVVMLSVTAFLIVAVLNVLYRPILSLKEVVLDLSQGNGDLTRRLPVTSDDDLGQISQCINAFIANLQSLMLEVSQSSDHISRSVDHLKSQTDANNKVLTAHSSETEQIVAAIEEMSATASEVASNASEASQFTHRATTQVTESKNVVAEATTTVSQLVKEVENTSVNITEIGQDTLEITNVLTVIGGIADQTNLLALNAAIEAARAGEQGRGFAVVADEVRTLASRTQASTAEIEQTLEKLRKGSTAAIGAMELTKSTCEKTAENSNLVANDLDIIVQSVIHINDLSTHIATAAEEQSSVTGEITRNMATIREIVCELSANGEETSNETINLAAANSQLKSVVSKFRLQ